MNMQSIAAKLFAVFFTLSLVAQNNCPMEKAENVPADLLIGPAYDCGGLNYFIGGVQITTAQNGCPLFVIYTPPHQKAVESRLLTQVAHVGSAPITKTFFKCVTRWFLFIPIGSACVFSNQVNVGSVQLLITQGCPAIQP